MNKLILVIIFLCAIYFSNKINKKHDIHIQENFDNYKHNVTNYDEIVSNSVNLNNHRQMNLYGNQQILSDTDSILNMLKKKSRFISINDIDNKSIIGIFVNTTNSLSKLLDEIKYTQQDFMDERLPNGLLIFFLMVNTKYLQKKKKCMIENKMSPDSNLYGCIKQQEMIHPKDKNTFFKNLFKKLLLQVISMYKSKKSIDSRQVSHNHFSYVLYPVEKNYMFNPIVEVLIETGFRRVVFKFKNVTFYKLYL